MLAAINKLRCQINLQMARVFRPKKKKHLEPFMILLEQENDPASVVGCHLEPLVYHADLLTTCLRSQKLLPPHTNLKGR